jgi:hypothetical protein
VSERSHLRAFSVLASALAGAALAQDLERPSDQQLDAIERYKSRTLMKLENHNLVVNRVHRRSLVLRPENSSDGEVRELVQLTRKLAPGEIVNISEVTHGCSCEDGPACSESVSVITSSDKKFSLRPFVRVKDHWVLAAHTQRFRDMAHLRARRHEFPSSAAYGEAWDTLLARFPYCQEAAAVRTVNAL